MAQLGVPGDGCWAPPPSPFAGAVKKERAQGLSNYLPGCTVSEAFSFNWGSAFFLKRYISKPWFGNCSLETKTLPLSKLPQESSSPGEKGHEEGGLSTDGARVPVVARPTAHEVPRPPARSPWKPAFLPCPRQPAFSSPASYNEDEKEEDAEAGNRLALHSPECFHGGTRRAVWQTSPQ